MTKKGVPIVFHILFGLALIGLAVLGYGYVSVRSERGTLGKKADELEKKIVLLEKKYSENRALEQQLVRARTQVEGRLRGLQGELDKLSREKVLLLEEKSRTEEDLKKVKDKVVSLEAGVRESSDRNEKLKVGLDDAEKKHAESIKKHQGEMERLSAERKQSEDDSQSALRAIQQKLERSESNNARLAMIAEELAEKFKNKGLTTSVLQAEPFTQIRKVEMENLLEEYRERIEKEKLKAGGAKKP